jgi:hypothetical protein
MKWVFASLKLDCCQKSPGSPNGVCVRRLRGWAKGDTVLRPPRAQAARCGRLNDGSALGVSGTVGQVASTRRAPLTLDAQGHPGVQVAPVKKQACRVFTSRDTRAQGDGPAPPEQIARAGGITWRNPPGWSRFARSSEPHHQNSLLFLPSFSSSLLPSPQVCFVPLSLLARRVARFNERRANGVTRDGAAGIAGSIRQSRCDVPRMAVRVAGAQRSSKSTGPPMDDHSFGPVRTV